MGLLSLIAGALEAKQKKVVQKPVYMVGVGISLVDSAVFITDMHLVDSVTLEKKTKFLADRQLYSFQLQRYLEENYKGGPYVPSVFFSKNRKRMERKYLSVLVDQGQFRFKPEEYIEQEEIAVVKPKKKDKKK